MLRVLFSSIIVGVFLIDSGLAQTAPAPSNDGLLLPVALGFLLKIVLIVLGGMVKLLFLGFTSLGTSGVALLLGFLFLKNNGLSVPPWPAHHAPPPGWHDRGDWYPYRHKRIGYGYGNSYYRNGKHLKQTVDFYKPDVERHKSVYPVPVVTAIDPRRYQVDDVIPHHNKHENKSQLQEQWTPMMMVKDTESALVANGETDTFKKRTNELPQTHALAN